MFAAYVHNPRSLSQAKEEELIYSKTGRSSGLSSKIWGCSGATFAEVAEYLPSTCCFYKKKGCTFYKNVVYKNIEAQSR